MERYCDALTHPNPPFTFCLYSHVFKYPLWLILTWSMGFSGLAHLRFLKESLCKHKCCPTCFLTLDCFWGVFLCVLFTFYFKCMLGSIYHNLYFPFKLIFLSTVVAGGQRTNEWAMKTLMHLVISQQDVWLFSVSCCVSACSCNIGWKSVELLWQQYGAHIVACSK